MRRGRSGATGDMKGERRRDDTWGELAGEMWFDVIIGCETETYAHRDTGTVKKTHGNFYFVDPVLFAVKAEVIEGPTLLFLSHIIISNLLP